MRTCNKVIILLPYHHRRRVEFIWDIQNGFAQVGSLRPAGAQRNILRCVSRSEAPLRSVENND